MTDQQIKEKVIEIAADEAGVPAAEVLPEHSLVNDLNFDSLAQFEMVMAIEETFHISVSDEQAAGIQTVGQAIELVLSVVRQQVVPQ